MSQTASFRLERNGSPITIVITAFFAQRTQQVLYTVTSASTGQVLLRDGTITAASSALDQFAATFPGDANQVQAAQQFLDQTQQGLAAASDTQGPDTTSAGETTIEAQQSRDSGASTQAPPPAPVSSTSTGEVAAAPAATVPSNAALTESEVIPELPPAPQKLPAGTVTDGTTSAPVPVGAAGPRPATQVSLTNSAITAPAKNTNLVTNIYRATRVVSNFRQGRFTQEVMGAQVYFTVPPRVGANPSGRVGGSEAIRDETGQVSNIRRNTETGELYTATPGVVYADDAQQNFSYNGATPTGQPPVPSRTGDSGVNQVATDANPSATTPLSSQPPTSGTTDISVATTPGAQPLDTAATSTTERQQGAWEP